MSRRRGARLGGALSAAALVLLSTSTAASAPGDGDAHIDPTTTTSDDDVVAPGTPTRADLPDDGIAGPAPTPGFARQALQVGGAFAWAETISQAGDAPGSPEPNDGFGSAIVVADINGDGIGDLVTGVPDEDVGTVNSAGAIVAIPGGVRAFNRGAATYHTQSGPIPGGAEPGDRFGASLAVGDFDGNGAVDIVVGVPGEGLGSRFDVGTIAVIPTTLLGLHLDASTGLSQSTNGVPGSSESDDRFGEALAVGDFDGDGFDDLAVGVPGEDLRGRTDAGAVIVVYGGPGGLRAVSAAQFWSQWSPGVGGTPEPGDLFGAALAAGDLNGDGRDDLVVGAPGEALGSTSGAGLVHVLFGTTDGLLAHGGKAYSQSTAGVGGTPKHNDGFGSAIAVGDLDLDGFDDVAIGVPGQGIAGGVNVLMASVGGNLTGGPVLSQNSSGMPGANEAGDGFGATVLIGNLTGDAREDLLVGAPGEDIGSKVDAGALFIVPGSAGGIATGSARFLSANSPGVPGSAEPGDLLGSALAAGDLNGDGTVDLAAGIPGEGVGRARGAGSVVTSDVHAPIPWAGTDRADDLSGDQIHVIYALPKDAAQPRAMDAAIRVDTAVVDEFFDGQLGGKHLRWDTYRGALDLSTIRLPMTEAQIAANGAFDMVVLADSIIEAGFDHPDKDYVVYYEGQGSASSTCGVTFSYEVSILWLDACGGVYPSFTEFPFGSTYLHAHELTHLLGAVASSAPNHCCAGHVSDDNRDVLYQNPGGTTVRNWGALRLDPGHDDYYLHTGGWDDVDDNPRIG